MAEPLAQAIQPGLGAATSGPAGQSSEKLEAAAREFESVFLAQMLRTMAQGLSDDNPLGNPDKDAFASLLQDEHAKIISRAGGIGVADVILQEMLKLQEVE